MDYVPNRHLTLKQSRINVDVTSRRCFNFVYLLGLAKPCINQKKYSKQGLEMMSRFLIITFDLDSEKYSPLCSYDL